jgi:hypothetical protein
VNCAVIASLSYFYFVGLPDDGGRIEVGSAYSERRVRIVVGGETVCLSTREARRVSKEIVTAADMVESRQ